MTSYASITARHPDQQDSAPISSVADLNDGNLVYAVDLEAEYEQHTQHQQQTPQTTDDEVESEHFLDSLDDVHTRFLLNVPQDELSTSERIFFQLEQAWWYYEDLICDKLEQETGHCPLPRFPNLKPFSKRLFEFSPLLRDLDFHKLWKEFAIYKRKISTYGCILLNKECTRIVLCKFYKSSVWTFPAGKINQNEIGVDAAAREVYEETGFDPHCLLGGLTKNWLEAGENDKIVWTRPLQDPEDALTFVEQPSGKRRTCYVCCGVPEDFPFEPVCRKEIDAIEWIDLRDIKDYKTFAVLPFVGKLKKWIKKRNNNSGKKQKKKDRKNKSRPKSRDKSSCRDASSGRDRSSQRQQRRSSSRKKDREQLVDAGLIASMGESTRWTAEEMFETNSKLMGGRIVEYDGNPHEFAEKGFGVDDEATGSQRIDPHSFRVVGGSFMNSQHGDQLAEASDPTKMAAKYQPLVREDTGGVAGLQPFFSQQGVTPWGEKVGEASSDGSDGDHLYEKDDDGTDHYEDGGFDGFAQEASSNIQKASHDLRAMLSVNQKGKKNNEPQSSKPQAPAMAPVSGDYNYDNDDGMMIFATDLEITAKKQSDYERQKQQQSSSSRGEESGSSREEEARRRKKEQMIAQYEADMAFVHNWVKNLPNPVGFEIQNVDAIIDKHFGKGAAPPAAQAG